MTDAVAIAAATRGFDPDTVRAIVEVESGPLGAFGADGRATILYEPHVAWRAASPAQRDLLRAAGLAYPKWGAEPYPQSQARRWEQFEGCADIAGRDVAIQACSWGLGQVLGLNWRLCDFDSPGVFEAAQATEAGQVETLLRYLEGAGLRGAINGRDWTAIARGYNGPQHAKHDYAGRMEAAYRRITGDASPQVLRIGSTGPAVKQLQRALGEREDGQFGPRTEALVRLFQAEHGLAVDGVVGARTWALLFDAGATPIRPRAQPAPTPNTDMVETSGKIAAGAGAVTAVVKGVTEASDAVAQAAAGVPPWLLLAIAAGAAAIIGARFWRMRQARRAAM